MALDLLAALGLIATLVGMALPTIQEGLDDAMTSAAARWMSAQMAQARVHAVMRSASVAIRFGTTADRYRLEFRVDGNGNGILTDDVRSGTDREVAAAVRVDELFPGVRVGTLEGLPAIERGADPPGAEPVRFGVSRTAVFSADGTATPGTVYILGRRMAQYAVRVTGETGRVRIWRFGRASQQWRPL